MPSINTPINFCPSWAPCINAIAAPPPIWEYLKKLLVFPLSNPPKMNPITFTVTQPIPNPKNVDNIRPYTTFIHSLPFIPLIPPCSAIAAPEIPAIKAWLSLVGIPKYHAAVAHTTIANKAAHNAINA